MCIGFRLAAISVLAAMVIMPEAAFASCKEGMCVSGHDVGTEHVIDFSTTLSNVTHFNFNDGSGQRELGAHETQVRISIGTTRPITIHYAFQGCSGGGTFQKSRCSPWANFEHTAQ